MLAKDSDKSGKQNLTKRLKADLLDITGIDIGKKKIRLNIASLNSQKDSDNVSSLKGSSNTSLTYDKVDQIVKRSEDNPAEKDNNSSKDSEFSFMNDDEVELDVSNKKKSKRKNDRTAENNPIFVKKRKNDSESEDEQVVDEKTHAVKMDDKNKKNLNKNDNILNNPNEKDIPIREINNDFNKKKSKKSYYDLNSVSKNNQIGAPNNILTDEVIDVMNKNKSKKIDKNNIVQFTEAEKDLTNMILTKANTNNENKNESNKQIITIEDDEESTKKISYKIKMNKNLINSKINYEFIKRIDLYEKVSLPNIV